jgi:hypothetical protein
VELEKLGARSTMDSGKTYRYTKEMEDIPADTLTIHITGGASPETVGAGELGELLLSLEQSVFSIAQRDDPDSPESGRLALVGISAGTLSLALSVPKPLLPAITLLCSRFVSGDISDLPEKCRRAIISLGKWCRARSYNMDWLLGKTLIGSITPSLDLRFEASPQLRGSAVLSGEVHSVGGERPSFKLRLASGELLVCACGDGLARLAGKYLYRKVTIEGFARNNILTGEIASFEATAISLTERKLSEAFDSIREQFGSDFDAVDVDGFMNKVRGE